MKWESLMIESRRDERFALRLPAKVEVLGENRDVEEQVIRLETENICWRGAYFTTLCPLPEGTKVKIDLLLNFDKSTTQKELRPRIKVKGEVVRSERTGMAVGFDGRYKIISPPGA